MRHVKVIFQSTFGWKIVLVRNGFTCRGFYYDRNLPGSYAADYCQFEYFIQIWDERKTGSGHSDQPVMYDNGWVVYDQPDAIPAVVKKACKRLMLKYRHLTHPA